ncbi:MAG: ABC transporter ATP-binding protein [Candidatus Hydrogenedentes bacterium]|nr:ABC transporter ATP-binding protein [Candidatus Hydrogenedentota bacterium]
MSANSVIENEPLLNVQELHTYFFLDKGVVRAVQGVNLVIPRGGTLGLVGESGCGKSVMALSVLRLISPPGRIVSGRVTLHQNGRARVLTDMSEDGPDIRRIRGKEIAMVFQEPMSSLSPVHTIGSQITEAITLHTELRNRAARDQAMSMLARVGIPDALRRFRQFPHELSGGMRQRAMIAMALSCRPALLIADEPTTALDVTIQAQILELMRELQREFSMTILLITHDLGVIAEMTDQVAVMYLGRVVEQASAKVIFTNPSHPYTQALLDSIPAAQTARKTALRTIAGTLPDPFTHLEGCPFHPRCPEAVAGTCDRGNPPPLEEIAPAHPVACSVRTRGTGS